ncbi:MAG: hypothetical protein QOF78_2917 [Phycisphaerales bacterium]|jgi:hypothetical protein|nr:hypothetical protein [Phycisphaerales bacterium]
MHILASDFSGLAWIFLAMPITLIALALISFIPASRGHWSAVLFAAPPVLFGLMFIVLLMLAGSRSARAPLGTCALLLTPPVLGILSLGVWSERRRSRE